MSMPPSLELSRLEIADLEHMIAWSERQLARAKIMRASRSAAQEAERSAKGGSAKTWHVDHPIETARAGACHAQFAQGPEETTKRLEADRA